MKQFKAEYFRTSMSTTVYLFQPLKTSMSMTLTRMALSSWRSGETNLIAENFYFEK